MMKGHRYHVTGVTGTGMSALAEVLIAAGCCVSGSDRQLDADRRANRQGAGSVAARLHEAGVVLVPQDGSGVCPGTEAVVVSTAIESTNPDLLAAARHNIPVRHRADLLAALAHGHALVAIAGSSGKSTVTGMIGWILEGAGYDPVVINGAPLLQWAGEGRTGSTRWGQGSVWVLEADESDQSLLKFSPDKAVVTNVSRDHFDIDETRRLFERFEARVAGDVIRGYGPGSVLKGFAPHVAPFGSVFDFRGEPIKLGVPGQHNAENALMAATLCATLGVSLTVIRNRLGSFQGLQRRLALAGRVDGVTVLDDYAHNPAKIQAAWSTAQRMGKRVIGLWRPHGYGPLAAMMDELASVFGSLCTDKDRLWVLPVYDVGGTARRTVSASDLVTAVCRRGTDAEAVVDMVLLARRVVEEVRSGDVVLVMGARDPGLSALAHAIVEGLRGKPKDRSCCS